MADAAKKDRKPPQPRGLNVELPLDTTQELQELGLLAGHTTKADLEAAFSAFLVNFGLDAFRAHLLDTGQQRVAVARAKLAQTSTSLDRVGGALKVGLAESAGKQLAGLP